ncbi:MAG: GntR family transcriptional regulator [Kiritimatiellaeota bacterium]|nr:GntR family transcriptional regulator [Kiritimatiellota bacterium]
MFQIDRNNGIPLRHQLREGLLKHASTLGVGAKMPTEEELCATFSVARMTP